MKQENFIAAESQRFERPDNPLRGLVKVRNHDDHAALAEEFQKALESLAEVGFRAGFGLLEAAQKSVELPLAVGGTDVVADLVVEND